MLISCIEIKSDLRLEAQIDNNNYDESELISVKVPAEHLSYYKSSEQFERVSGQIEIKGLQYNYVKRRLYNDSIEMLCIPNHMAMHLKNAANDFFKLVNDLQHPGQQKKPAPHTSKNLMGDYCTLYELFQVGNLFNSSQKKTFNYTAGLLSNSSATDERPPDMIA
jgi:hypothetical protein